jgi:NADH-quinone oxidoreductase subunit L
MTAFYMFRLLFLAFFGYSRADEHVEKHIHESPPTMTVPLVILAVLSVIGGWIGWPGSLGGENHFEKFLEPVLAGALTETGPVKITRHTLAVEYILMLASLSIAAPASGSLINSTGQKDLRRNWSPQSGRDSINCSCISITWTKSMTR